MTDTLPTVDQLAQRLRDLAEGARSKADLIASKSPTSVYTDPVDVLRALAKEMERGLPPEPVTFDETKGHLEGLPLVAALWWFIENSNEDDPHRNELFFYLRERVRNLDPKAEYLYTTALAKGEA
jgi:hypothetical protein